MKNNKNHYVVSVYTREICDPPSPVVSCFVNNSGPYLCENSEASNLSLLNRLLSKSIRGKIKTLPSHTHYTTHIHCMKKKTH